MADETPRSRAQIEAELASARARLAENLESLVGEVHPQSIKERRLEDVKSFAQNEFTNAKEQAKAQVMDEDGALRVERIAIIAGAAVGVVALIVVASVASKKRKQNSLQAQVESMAKQLEENRKELSRAQKKLADKYLGR